MAVVGPVLVADTTNTGGTGSLSLNNASSDGRRGLADAVTNGDAANTDTVHYLILASGTSGGSLRFEKGKGTISDAGATLSRDTVHQSSNSGSKVALPGGSTHDVLIAVGLEDLVVAANEGSEFTPATFATNLGLPRLAAANTYTENQTLKRTDTATGVISAGSRAKGLADIAARFDMRGDNSANEDILYATIRLSLADPTDASEDGTIQFLTLVNGSLGVRATIAGGVLQDASGNKYDAFPSGTKMMFGTAPPSGWTRQNETQSRVIRLAKSGDTIGATGGSDDIFDGSWTTAAHTLTEAQIPSHDHQIGRTSNNLDSNSDGLGTQVSAIFDPPTAGSNPTDTFTTGGGGSHNHIMNTPYYTIACWATKD